MAADEERRLRAALEVRKEGDVNAPKELADDLKRIGESADEIREKLDGAFDPAEKELQALKREAAAAKASLEETGGAIEEVGEQASTAASGGIEKLLSQFAKVGTAIGGVDLAVRKLEDILGDLSESAGGTGEEFDGLAKRLYGPWDQIAEGWGSLKDVWSALRKEGISLADMFADYDLALAESTGAVDEQIEAHDRARQKLAEVREGLKSTEDSSEAAEAAYKKWTESLGIGKEKLDEAAQQLAEFAEKFAANNKQLGQSDLAAIIGPQIQKLLDQYARLGQEVPPALQKVADAWGVVPKAAEQAAAASEAAAKKISQALVGEFGKTSEEVRKIAQEVTKALGSIDVGKLELVDPKQFAEAKQQVQELVNQFRVLGEKIPPDLEKAAGALGVFLTGLDVEKVDVFAGAATDLSKQMTQVVTTFDEAGNKITTVTDGSLAEAGDQLDEVAKAADRLKESAEGADRPFSDLGAAADKSKKPLEDQGTAAEDSGKKTKDAAEQAEKLAKATEAAAAAATRMKDALEAFGDLSVKAVDALEKIETAMGRIVGIDVGPLIAGVRDLGDAAEQAAEQFDRLDAGGAPGGAAPGPAPGGG